MTSFYEHSQPEGGNAKLICILKLLSQAACSWNYTDYVYVGFNRPYWNSIALEKTPISCIFYTHSFFFSSPSNPVDQLPYSHFNSSLGSWIAINVFRKEDASPCALQSVSKILGRTWMNLGFQTYRGWNPGFTIYLLCAFGQVIMSLWASYWYFKVEIVTSTCPNCWKCNQHGQALTACEYKVRSISFKVHVTMVS